ncbi:putative MFS family arabinose efflux permease [Streptomyces sp. SLBN-118]|uniref:MFS transporter n=1 Tax=Streptomyces sp. SLBN-118 TaxID=2768454 RepID=UPI00116D91E0|nr:MFS transporter [Streptomyces sp. SLBN-118]TQK50347.1 putative MFS family arabinose efflux permease [Streptomyces sp. SLBN-118]
MGLLRQPAFRRLWAGQAVTQFGTQISILALPLTALTTLNASAFEVSAVQAVQVAPYLLIGLPAGAWVDRMPRKPVLITADLVRALVLLTVPVSHMLGVLTLAQLYAVGLTIGAATVFFDIAYQSYLPDILPADDLAEGNSKLELARSGALVGGHAAGGWLIGLLRGPVALCVDILSFLFSAVMVWRIPGRPRPPEPAARTGRLPCQDIIQGLKFVRHHRLLAPITITSCLTNLSYAMVSALLVTYATRQLGFSPARIGLVMALSSAGMVGGALASRRAARRIGTGPTIVAASLLCGAGPLLLPLAGYAAPHALLVDALLVGGLLIQAVGAVVLNVNQVSVRQAVTPRLLMGRMNATVRFVSWGALPVGALLGGALAQVVGLHSAMWLSALVGAPVFLGLALSDVRRVGADGGPRCEEPGTFAAVGRSRTRR